MKSHVAVFSVYGIADYFSYGEYNRRYTTSVIMNLCNQYSSALLAL